VNISIGSNIDNNKEINANKGNKILLTNESVKNVETAKNVNQISQLANIIWATFRK
jgi:hypothetical protein